MTGEGRNADRVPMRDAAHNLPLKAIGGPMTVASHPIPVHAWIFDRRDGDQCVDAVATAWTPKAVRVDRVDQHGRAGQLWVWANAVTRAESGDRGRASR